MQNEYYYTHSQDRADRIRREIEHYEQCPSNPENKAELDTLYDTLYCITNDC